MSTGLETTPAQDPKDSNWWRDTISSGLGIIGSVVGSDESESEKDDKKESKKILGVPTYAAYTVLAAGALVGTVLLVRKLRKK